MNTDILQTVFSDCPMGIAHLEIIADEQNNSADYRFMEVNKAFLNICSLNQANILEKTVSQLFPKTETTVSDWHNLFRRIGKSDKAAEFEYYLDELKQWYQVHVYLTDKQFVTLMLIDISIIKKAIREQDEKEEELIKTKANTDDTNANVTAIIEGTTDSIWAFDLNYNILYINHVFQKDFEASFGVRLEKGSNLLNALPEILRPIWKPRYDRALSNEQHTIIDEVDTAIGKLYIQVTFNPIVNKGRVIGGSCFGSNITERKRVENELQLQALVLDQIKDHVTITDLNGIITFVNRAVSETMKLDKHEIIGNTTIIYGEDTERGASQQEILSNTLESGRWRGEIVNYAKDETKHIMDCRTQVVYNVNKIPVALCGIATEITERKQTEEALLKIQNRNRALLEAIPDLIFVFNQDYFFIDYHTNNIDAMFLAPENFIGKNISDTLPEPIANKTIDVLKKVFTTKQIQEYEYELEINGKQHFFEARAVYSTPEQALIIVRDVSQRKKSEIALEQAQKYLAEKEAQYRLIAENSTDLIYLYHLIPEPHYKYISPSCLQLTGYKPEEGYADPFSYHKFINTQAGIERFTKFLLNPTQPTSIEEEWKKKDGSLIWVEQLISRNFDENGNLISFQSTVRDITERKQTEEILRTERMRLAGIIEGTNVGTWEWNIQTGTVIYNSRWAEIIGYKLEEISSSINTWDNFTHPEDLSKSYDLLNKHFVGEMAYYESELRMMHKNGNWVWILDRGKVVSWTDDGKPRLMMGTHQDITERKHAELKLKASEENLSQLIELAPDAFVHGNNKGNIIGTNNRAVEIFGYSKEELLLMNIKDFFPSEVLEEKPLRFDLLNKGITLKMERKLRRNNGDIVFIEMNSKAMPDGSYQSFIRDITERRQAEIKLNLSEKKFREISTLMRLMTDNMPDMLWAKNLKKEFIFTNKAICNNLLNAVDTEEPLGKTDLFFALRERNSQPDNPKWHTFGEICRDSDSITLEEMKPMQFDEFGNVKGKFLFLDVYKTPLYDEKGQLIGVVGSARDITERKYAEEALKESEKMLRELNAQKDKFFSIIAHDLKSPFNSILGFSQLLVEQIKEKDFDGIEEYAKIMLHSSEHAFSLLSNLLEWSQAQSGKIEFNPEFFELIEFIENIIPIFDDVAKQKSINILRMLPHNIPIYADKHMISTVLRNFINNAIKFTNQGGKIEVVVKYVQNEVIISVKDNGIGIKKNRLEKLFRIDESESTPGTANEKGTGLGLILCKEFVEKHNGKIWVLSDEGIGSAFSFSIPAYKKL